MTHIADYLQGALYGLVPWFAALSVWHCRDIIGSDGRPVWWEGE